MLILSTKYGKVNRHRKWAGEKEKFRERRREREGMKKRERASERESRTSSEPLDPAVLEVNTIPELTAYMS